jgi:hypothetical protein
MNSIIAAPEVRKARKLPSQGTDQEAIRACRPQEKPNLVNGLKLAPNGIFILYTPVLISPPAASIRL